MTVYVLKKKRLHFFSLFKYLIFEYLNARVLFTMIKKLYVLKFEYIKGSVVKGYVVTISSLMASFRGCMTDGGKK